ncbi:MAG: DUF1501 domain-containing protein [Planctomycetes bacterium]|nr:DUF1501 domain-containing protein [Planctomycetota bacterium]
MHTTHELGNLTRRDALRYVTFGSCGWALTTGLGRTFAATPKPRRAKARSVIQIWMWGGPSHLDTFDPKPDAGADYCGPLTKPIATNVDGMRIGQLLPELARLADQYSLVRSLTHGINGHETASYVTQTGHTPSGKRIVYPSVGAVVSHMLRGERTALGKLPPYVVLTRPLGRFSEVGFLGMDAKPFVTGGDPNQDPFAVEGIVQPGITPERRRARRSFLEDLDEEGPLARDPRMQRFDACRAGAWETILGDTAQVFDLSRENDAMRERYGRNTFGQACLAARRLVERGVPYVSINYAGWDTHKRHFETLNRKLPEFDRGLATLLRDLQEHGLLETTLVWCGGEFGRTPAVQWQEPWNGGRGHYGRCFSALLAGGGLQGGRVVGSSDARGEDVAERPVHPRDLIATLYTCLGIDPHAPLGAERGIDARVLPPSADGTSQVAPLEELL